jgi:hypothetical protein
LANKSRRSGGAGLESACEAVTLVAFKTLNEYQIVICVAFGLLMAMPLENYNAIKLKPTALLSHNASGTRYCRALPAVLTLFLEAKRSAAGDTTTP